MAGMQKVIWFLSKYDRRSLILIIVVACMFSTVAYLWRDIIGPDDLKDPLLLSIWAFMLAVLVWNLDGKRDFPRMAVGLAGGLFIENWGTHTSIWTYYTDERPPLWILPAWPVAAISIDRIARVLDLACSQVRIERLWWVMVIGFPILMLDFVWPYMNSWTTIVAVLTVFATFALVGDRRQDVALMLAGAGLGVFLEYWGTSRMCWTYYTREVPPVFAVFAHGLAALSFQRGALIVTLLLRHVGERRKGSRQSV